MGLFGKKSQADIELEARLDRLESECRQARAHCESLSDDADRQNCLRAIEAAERDLHEARAESDQPTRTGAALRVEAELCLTKPVAMLAPTADRLRDKLYRLDDREREAWEKELDRSISNGEVLQEETLRPRLQLLTYRSTEAAYRYRRLAKERSNVISIMLGVSLLIVTALLCGIVFSLNYLLLGASHGMNDCQDAVANDGLSWARVAFVFALGGLGAMVSIVPSMIAAEKQRSVYWHAYILDILVRVVFGGVYAFIVYSATLAHILPIAVPSEPLAEVSFLAVLGLASGYSDRFFHQVLSSFITGTTSSSKAKSGAGSRT